MAIIHLNDLSVKDVGNRRIERQVLLRSQTEAAACNIKYSGAIEPEEAWKLFTRGIAHLIDIRRKKERYLYGYIPNTFHVQWNDEDAESDQFSQRLSEKLPQNSFIMLLNSQGSDGEAALAAQQATESGFAHIFVVREGYENRPYAEVINSEQHGWRSRGLPWVAGRE